MHLKPTKEKRIQIPRIVTTTTTTEIEIESERRAVGYVIDGAVTGEDEEEIANLNGGSVKAGNGTRSHLLPVELRRIQIGVSGGEEPSRSSGILVMFGSGRDDQCGGFGSGKRGRGGGP